MLGSHICYANLSSYQIKLPEENHKNVDDCARKLLHFSYKVNGRLCKTFEIFFFK